MVLEVVKPSPSSTPEDVGALAAQVDLEAGSWLGLHTSDHVHLQQSTATWRTLLGQRTSIQSVGP